MEGEERMHRKCDNFRGYRKPTPREAEYISKRVYPFKVLVAYLLGTVAMLVCDWQILVMGVALYSMRGDNRNPLQIFGMVGCLLAVFLVFTYWVGVRFLNCVAIRKGMYEVLEGNAEWTGVSETVKRHTSYGIKEDFRSGQYITDFVSVYGEVDKRLNSNIPQGAYILQLINGKATDFPVLLVKIRGRVRYVIPDWKRILKHQKYSGYTPERLDLTY